MRAEKGFLFSRAARSSRGGMRQPERKGGGGQLCKDKEGGGEVSDKAVSVSSPLPPLSHTVTAKNTETMKVRADGLMKSGGETEQKKKEETNPFLIFRFMK